MVPGTRTKRTLAAVAFLVVAACKKPEPAPAAVVDAAPPPTPPPVASEAPPASAAASEAAPAPTTTTKKAATPAADPDSPFSTGDAWSGTYACGSKPSTGTLKITKVAGNNINGIFDFKIPSGKAGSYKMSGVYTPETRRLVLTAGEWIVQSSGLQTVNFDGTVSQDKRTVSGKAKGAGCNNFAFKH
jgi:hypothetical protein